MAVAAAMVGRTAIRRPPPPTPAAHSRVLPALASPIAPQAIVTTSSSTPATWLVSKVGLISPPGWHGTRVHPGLARRRCAMPGVQWLWLLFAAALGADSGIRVWIPRALSGIKAEQTNSMTVHLAVWSSYSAASRP